MEPLLDIPPPEEPPKPKKRLPKKHLLYIALGLIAWVGLLVGIRWFLLNAESPEEKRRRELIEKYQPRFDELQTRVKKLLEGLPPRGSVRDGKGPPLELSPTPDATNMAVASVDGLLDPERSPDDRVKVHDHNDDPEWSAVFYRWRPDENIIKGELDELPGIYDRILNIRYLVAVRILAWSEPQYIKLGSEERHEPGRAIAEVFFFDLEKEKLLFSFPIRGFSLPVEGAGKRAWEQAKLSLRTILRNEMVQKLRDRISTP